MRNVNIFPHTNSFFLGKQVNEMKKIAIVGANSYIARNVILRLQQRFPECELKLYDYAEGQVDGQLKYTTINILDKDSVAKMDLICDIIYMFIGKTGSANGFDDCDTFLNINEKALLNLLNEYRRQNSKAKIVFPSTRLVYKGKKGKLSEDAEKEFKTIYAINKYACEQYLAQYRNVFGVKYCIFRICIPYGTLISGASSYGTAEFMLKKAQQNENIILYGDGSVRRTLTYMGDLCDILIDGGINDSCENTVYNIGGEDYSLKEMAELIAKKYNVGVDFVEWPEVALKIESGDTVFDDCKLKRVLNYQLKKTFIQWID